MYLVPLTASVDGLLGRISPFRVRVDHPSAHREACLSPFASELSYAESDLDHSIKARRRASLIEHLIEYFDRQVEMLQ